MVWARAHLHLQRLATSTIPLHKLVQLCCICSSKAHCVAKHPLVFERASQVVNNKKAHAQAHLQRLAAHNSLRLIPQPHTIAIMCGQTQRVQGIQISGYHLLPSLRQCYYFRACPNLRRQALHLYDIWKQLTI